MKRLLSFIAVGLLLLPRLALAQGDASELKPIIVTCLASYQVALDNIRHVGTLLGEPDIYPNRVNVMLGLLLETKDLKVDDIKALDRTRPLGMAVLTNGQSIVPLNMFPLDGEAEDFFASLKPLVGEAKLQDNGVYALGPGMLAGFAKVENGWLYHSQTEEHVTGALPDPMAVFGDLPQQYNLSLRMYVKDLPEVYRSLLVDQMRVIVESTAQPKPSEGDGEFNFRRSLARLQSHLVDRGLGESDLVTFGVSLDPESQGLGGDLHLTPTPDTPFAEHLAELAGAKTRFGNTSRFAGESDVLMAVNMTGPLDPDGTDEYLGVVDGYRDYTLELIDKSGQIHSDEERETLKELTGALVDVVRATIEAGKLDVAVRMTGKGSNRSLVFAGRVADIDKLTATIEQIGQLAQTDAGFAEVKLNVADHLDTPIHSFTLKPDPKSQEGQLARFFGGELKLQIAVHEDSVFIGVGADALDLVKQAMEQNEVEVLPLTANVRLTPMLQLGIMALNNPQFSTFGSILSSHLAGKDLAKVVAQPTPEGGLHVHFETESGAVRLAGAMFGQLGPMIINLTRQQQGR